MFTGLIAQKGTIVGLHRGDEGARLRVACGFDAIAEGESIAVDGTCLTVVAVTDDGFTADASAETLSKTALADRAVGDHVHLERSLRQGDRVGGHLVTGHVDGVGRLVERAPLGDAETVTFEVPDALAAFVAPKGSVAIDGVSLTVNEVRGRRFDVVLVPYTRRETTFDERPLGARVNVEVDVLAKYVARLLGKPGVDGSGAGPFDGPGTGS